MDARSLANDLLTNINIYLQQIGKPCHTHDANNKEKKLIHLESQLTLIELKNLLNLSPHDPLNPPLHPVPFFKSLIERYLIRRWEERLKNTRAAYPYNPSCPANLACEELAIKLLRYYPEYFHPFKMLIPTLVQKPTPCLALHHYILSDDNTGLINVREYLIHFINMQQYWITINGICRSLSISEIQRIQHHSSEIETICHLINLNEHGEANQLPTFSEEERNALINRINYIFNDRNEINLFLPGYDENTDALLYQRLFGEKITLNTLIDTLSKQDPLLWKFYLNILNDEDLIAILFNHDHAKQEMLKHGQGQLILIKTIPSLLQNPLLYQSNHDEQNRAVLFILTELYLRLRNMVPDYTGFFGMITGYAKSKKIDSANWLSEHLVSCTLPQLAALFISDQTATGALTHGTLGCFVNQILFLANQLPNTDSVKPCLNLG